MEFQSLRITGSDFCQIPIGLTEDCSCFHLSSFPEQKPSSPVFVVNNLMVLVATVLVSQIVSCEILCLSASHETRTADIVTDHCHRSPLKQKFVCRFAEDLRLDMSHDDVFRLVNVCHENASDDVWLNLE